MCALLGMAVLAMAAQAQAAGAPLPKVRIAADGRHFETADGRPFVPFGVNYYRPNTGWPPKIWNTFDAEATARHMALLNQYGGNCVRVFVTWGSMYREVGQLTEAGIAKFDRFLEICEANGIYVHPTGPEHWEGGTAASRADTFSEEGMVALEQFWKLFAGRYKGRNVIFAYDLRNEPSAPRSGPAMQARWNRFVRERYGSGEGAARAWGLASVDLDRVPMPGAAGRGGRGAQPAAGPDSRRMLLDFQHCREELADEWTRRQVEAIKSADPDALVTVGAIQWSIPSNLGNVMSYSAFRPERQARYLDFLSFHFYPLEQGSYEYDDPVMEQRNLAYLEGIAREVAKVGKPVLIGEFGWYGGGTFRAGGRHSRFATEQQQADFVARLIQVTDGLVCGWLNWGMFDHPEARDVSRVTGLFTVDEKPKAWGERFRQLAAHYAGRRIELRTIANRPDLPWDECIVNVEAANAFRDAYFAAFATEGQR